MLRIHNLNVHYGVIHALHDLSLEVAKGEIVTLIGSNGAGKSTTLLAPSGLLQPSGGTLEFDGKDLRTVPAHLRVSSGLGQVPEGRRVFSTLSVAENLALGAYTRRDKAAIPGDLEEVYTLFPRLRERMAQAAGTLSGGEQQMLAVGRAMMSRPRLLWLGEPGLGLARRVGPVAGGDRRVLAVGGAMMGGRRLLLLDEPSLGLAPLLVKEIFNVIK